MLAAGITLIKFGVMPLYNPKTPSLRKIVLNIPIILVDAGSIKGCETETKIKWLVDIVISVCVCVCRKG